MERTTRSGRVVTVVNHATTNSPSKVKDDMRARTQLRGTASQIMPSSRSQSASTIDETTDAVPQKQRKLQAAPQQREVEPSSPSQNNVKPRLIVRLKVRVPESMDQQEKLPTKRSPPIKRELHSRDGSGDKDVKAAPRLVLKFKTQTPQSMMQQGKALQKSSPPTKRETKSENSQEENSETTSAPLKRPSSDLANEHQAVIKSKSSDKIFPSEFARDAVTKDHETAGYESGASADSDATIDQTSPHVNYARGALMYDKPMTGYKSDSSRGYDAAVSRSSAHQVATIGAQMHDDQMTGHESALSDESGVFLDVPSVPTLSSGGPKDELDAAGTLSAMSLGCNANIFVPKDFVYTMYHHDTSVVSFVRHGGDGAAEAR